MTGECYQIDLGRQRIDAKGWGVSLSMRPGTTLEGIYLIVFKNEGKTRVMVTADGRVQVCRTYTLEAQNQHAIPRFDGKPGSVYQYGLDCTDESGRYIFRGSTLAVALEQPDGPPAEALVFVRWLGRPGDVQVLRMTDEN